MLERERGRERDRDRERDRETERERQETERETERETESDEFHTNMLPVQSQQLIIIACKIKQDKNKAWTQAHIITCHTSRYSRRMNLINHTACQNKYIHVHATPVYTSVHTYVIFVQWPSTVHVNI